MASATSAPSNGLGLLRVAGRDAVVVAFEAELVSFFLDAADMLGVPKSVAAIYGVCFASAEPLSFADIEARLDISAGSISQGLRVLREVGALRPVEGPAGGAPANGDAKRRDYYAPDLHLRNLVTRWLDQRLQKQIDSGHGRLKAVAKAIPPGRDGAAKILKSRVKTLQSWHDQARAVLPIVKSFLKLT